LVFPNCGHIVSAQRRVGIAYKGFSLSRSGLYHRRRMHVKIAIISFQKSAGY
jgi:hypothetical protein